MNFIPIQIDAKVYFVQYDLFKSNIAKQKNDVCNIYINIKRLNDFKLGCNMYCNMLDRQDFKFFQAKTSVFFFFSSHSCSCSSPFLSSD